MIRKKGRATSESPRWRRLRPESRGVRKAGSVLYFWKNQTYKQNGCTAAWILPMTALPAIAETGDSCNQVSAYWSRWGPTPDLRAGGPWPIIVHDGPDGRPEKLELLRPDTQGGPKTFTTTRALLRALHGSRGFGYNCPFDKYVRRGAYARPASRYDTTPSLTLVILEPTVQLPTELTEPVFDPALKLPPAVLLRSSGIDLAKRGHEVAKLLCKGFGVRIRQYGYEFDDVLQEVYRKLLVSNQGRSPWDPAKSSFGHFVHMVCRSALWNYHRAHLRRLPYEQIGLKGIQASGLWGDVDAAESSRARTRPFGGNQHHPGEALQSLSLHLLHQATCSEDTDAACLAVDILPLVQDGYGRGEIAGLLGLKPLVVSRALAYMRKQACSWDGGWRGSGAVSVPVEKHGVGGSAPKKAKLNVSPKSGRSVVKRPQNDS